VPILPRFLRWSALGLRAKGLFVVSLPVIPLAVFWCIVAVAVMQRPQPANTTMRSLVVESNLAKVYGDLLDADAGARRALLSGHDAAITRYRVALDRVDADLGALDKAVIDPALKGQLTELRALVADELVVLARLTESPTPPDAPWMSDTEALDRSSENLDHVQTLAAAMTGNQVALTAARTEQNRQVQRLYFFGFLIASIFCVGAGVVAALMLASGVSRRANAIAANAARLARGLAPEPLPVGEDEIGLVDAQLHEAAELLRRREDELRERTVELESANRELEAFSYSVSHDLRAPLRAIDGFSEALEEDCWHALNEEGRDSLRRVRSAARRMGTLIDELLNLSRLTRVEPRRERVNIGESASAILTELARHAPARQMDLCVEPDLVADADPELVGIALHNLLDNAWKYTAKKAKARIEIGVTPSGAARVFHVRDNGAGFDMARVGKLFGAFQRLHADRDFEGTGIGLAIVHRIVARHGGRIWAEGVVGDGATFYFTLEPGPRES